MTIGEVLANYESSAAAVAADATALAAAIVDDTPSLDAATARFGEANVLAADAADAVAAGLPTVGGAAFNRDKSRVYVADTTPQGFSVVTPAEPDAECDPDAKQPAHDFMKLVAAPKGKKPK